MGGGGEGQTFKLGCRTQGSKREEKRRARPLKEVAEQKVVLGKNTKISPLSEAGREVAF